MGKKKGKRDILLSQVLMAAAFSDDEGRLRKRVKGLSNWQSPSPPSSEPFLLCMTSCVVAFLAPYLGRRILEKKLRPRRNGAAVDSRSTHVRRNAENPRSTNIPTNIR